MELEYNTQREKLIISEYGRHIQKMVDYAANLNDRVERQKMAEGIIDLMGELNPHLRDVDDFKHKLWDHLFIMSDFKLDVNSPYEKPELDKLFEKPEPLLQQNQYTALPFPYAEESCREYEKSLALMPVEPPPDDYVP